MQPSQQQSLILKVKARQILDSRGNPTVQVDLITGLGLFRAAVPSGASTGKYEAVELRDNDKSQFLGKSVLKAIDNVNKIIGPNIEGMDCRNQLTVENLILKLDGEKNKSKLGANAILGVSLALAKSGAAANGLKLYEYIRKLSSSQVESNEFIMPCPAFNLINGGKHGGNGIAIQQFMIFPTGANSFSHAMRIGCEVYQHLKILIKKKYGLEATNVGDQGGFAPNLSSGQEALQILQEALKVSGHQNQVQIGMDCAASEFYNDETSLYDLNFKDQKRSQSQKHLTNKQLCQIYCSYAKKYPICSIEDPFDQDDIEGWSLITKELGESVQIVGDDLLVTNRDRIEKSIEGKHCNALLLKVNQIGSLMEAIDASILSKTNNWGTMVSHRSGQTEDTFIADLVVGLGTGQIKTGAPCRSQRLAKYNQLLRIEEELGDRAIYAGNNFKFPYQLLKKKN